MNENVNPWKGVVPYSDNEDLQQHPFRGRSKEIEELFDIINKEAVVTLYGMSGIGKTSLLNAGLFPRLRKTGCYPISIRLLNECPDGNYAQYIVSRLREIAVLRDKTVKFEDSEKDETDEFYLWEFFSRHDFVYNNDVTVPIIVLDQFEETLRHHPDKTLDLLRQIRAAKNEGYRNDGSFFEINFRIIISIREDDLYLLEDALDQHYIDQMKSSRYRLKPIARETAINEIVFIRDGLFDASGRNIAEQLVDKVALKDGAISTALLSLVCSMAYEAAGGGVITKGTIDTLGTNPLITFYKKCIEGLPESFIDWFEEKFTESDRRKIVYKNEIPKEYLPYVQRLADEQSKLHLLTSASGNSGLQKAKIPYELLHDKLADAIFKYRAERLASLKADRRQKVIRKWIIATAIAATIIVTSIVFIRLANRPIEYEFTGGLNGKEVPIYTRPYRVSSGVLKLKDCSLAPYTFYGNREVRRVELDSVDLKPDGLYLPNADTLVIGAKQWGFSLSEQVLPNLKTIIASKPSSAPYGWNQIRCLDTVIIQQTDSEYIRWDWCTKTLYARADTSRGWNVYVSALSRHLDKKEIIDNHNSPYYENYDIANPTPIDNNTNCYYRLINTDSIRFRSLRKGDIPSDVLAKTRFISLDHVDTIGSCAFEGANNVELVYLPATKYIGKKIFAYDPKSYHQGISYIYLPMVNNISDSAFFGWLNDKTALRYNTDAKVVKLAFGLNPPKNMLNYNSTDTLITEQEELGYYTSNDTLFLKSDRINELYIGQSINIIQGSSSVGEIKYDSKNESFYVVHGNLYRKKTRAVFLELRADSERIVSLSPHCVYGNMAINNSRCHEYVCLHRDDIVNIRNKNHVTLLVPYGCKYEFSLIGESFAGVKGMSWLETMYYRVFYGETIQKYMHNWKLMVTSDDILAFGTTIIVMLVILFMMRLFMSRRIIVFDWLIIIILLILIGYIVYAFSIDIIYTTSDGESFHTLKGMYDHLRSTESTYDGNYRSMWPTLWITLPLWITYLFLVRRPRNDKKEKN